MSITQKENIEVNIKHDGIVEICKTPIFLNDNNEQIGKGEKWRVAVMKGEEQILKEALPEVQADAIISTVWAE